MISQFIKIGRNKILVAIICMLVIFSCASAVSYFGFIEFSRYSMRAMNCNKFTADEFNLRLSKRLSQPVYFSDPTKPGLPVKFRFNLKPLLVNDLAFVIKSDKVDRAIYVGDYKDEIIVQAGDDLLKDKGGDSFKFFIFNKKDREICIYEHGSTRFWQPDKIVHIDFLPFRELNENTGEPVAFKVWFE